MSQHFGEIVTSICLSTASGQVFRDAVAFAKINKTDYKQIYRVQLKNVFNKLKQQDIYIDFLKIIVAYCANEYKKKFTPKDIIIFVLKMFYSESEVSNISEINKFKLFQKMILQFIDQLYILFCTDMNIAAVGTYIKTRNPKVLKSIQTEGGYIFSQVSINLQSTLRVGQPESLVIDTHPKYISLKQKALELVNRLEKSKSINKSITDQLKSSNPEWGQKIVTLETELGIANNKIKKYTESEDKKDSELLVLKTAKRQLENEVATWKQKYADLQKKFDDSTVRIEDLAPKKSSPEPEEQVVKLDKEEEEIEFADDDFFFEDDIEADIEELDKLRKESFKKN